MADTTADKFCRERLWPIAETLRAVKSFNDSTLAKWTNEFGLIFKDLESDKVDDRSNEGVSVVTASHVKEMVARIETIQSSLVAEGFDELIERFAVRAPSLPTI